MEYNGSFTAGGLLVDEFEAIASVLQGQDWEAGLLLEQKQNNLLKINSEKARKRVLDEIKKRIRLLPQNFWATWNTRSRQEKCLLLFFLCLKTYHLVYEFHFEITIPRYLSLDLEPDFSQYTRRLEEIASKDKKVNEWTETTRKKLISTYLTMLKKAGLLENKQFSKPEVDSAFYCFFLQNNEAWALDAFFLKKFEKEEIIKSCL